MLQKKLEKLESDVFRLPLDQTEFDDIKERLRFLDKLRAAEADSDQLRDIDERIARLKAAFSDSMSCGFNYNDEALSICSDCTHQALLLEEFSGHKLLEKDQKEAAVAGRMLTDIGKYCGVFGCGMIFGALCMALYLFCADYLIRDEAFLIPPT